jgi:hypothetical protein
MKQAIILAALLWLTPQMVADKCVSEAAFALPQCACTVVNRLRVGWSEYRVLDHYYAKSGRATPVQVATVAAVMDGRAACSPDLYFLYSASDVAYLGIGNYEPALVVRRGDQEVWLFERWFRRKQ